MNADTAALRTCSRCHEVKALTEFWYANRARGTLQHRCKPCQLAAGRESWQRHSDAAKARKNASRQRLRERDAEHVAAQKLRYRLAREARDPEGERVKRAAHHQRYYPQHRGQIIARVANWRRAHTEPKAKRPPRTAEDRREYARAWQRAHPDRKAMWTRKRKAMLANAEGRYTRTDWERIKAAQGYRCGGCDRQEPEIRLTIDHIVPISRGGSNWPANIQGLCGPCNSRKGAQLRH